MNFVPQAGPAIKHSRRTTLSTRTHTYTHTHTQLIKAQAKCRLTLSPSLCMCVCVRPKGSCTDSTKSHKANLLRACSAHKLHSPFALLLGPKRMPRQSTLSEKTKLHMVVSFFECTRAMFMFAVAIELSRHKEREREERRMSTAQAAA